MAGRRRTGGKARGGRAAGSRLRIFYVSLAVLVVAGGVWIGYAIAHRNDTGAMSAIPLSDIDDPQALLAQAQGVAAGSQDAAAPQVLIFSDFTCPACRVFATRLEPRLRAAFIQPGKIKYVYYDFPLDPSGGPGEHRYGFLAARAARCADEQGRFWEFHDLIFGHQSEWSFAPDPPIEAFVDYARQAEIDPGPFERCVRSDKYADVVSAESALGENLGLSQTPTLYVGNRAVQAWSNFDSVSAAIQRVLPK